MKFISEHIGISLKFVAYMVGGALITACQPHPPSQRPAVTLAQYQAGDANKGKIIYQDECEKCHKLQLGNNEKGPQLMRIYGAKSAELTDYQYSEALKNAQKIWTAQALDSYIANPKKDIPGTRMRSDPVSNPKDRQDIIAYLSTLR